MFYRAPLHLEKWKQTHGLKMARSTTWPRFFFIHSSCGLLFFTSKCVSATEWSSEYTMTLKGHMLG